MNSVQYDSQLSATIPISDYHAFDKAREAVRQDNYEAFITGELNPANEDFELFGYPNEEHPAFLVSAVYAVDPVEQFLAHTRRQRLLKIAEEIANSLLIKKEEKLGFPTGGGDFPDF